MNRSHLLALASAALIFVTGPAFAAAPNSSITGKDATGATVTMGAVSDGTLKSASHSLVDSTGAVISPATATNQATEITSLATIATNSSTQATAANQTSANTKLDTLHTDNTSLLSAVSGPIPAGTSNIGSSPAFTNSAGTALPPAADASVAINVSTATTTQLVALSSGKKIYVSALDVIAAGTGNITFVYGTGSNCGTGTTSLTGAYNLTAQAGIAKGNGLGAVLVVPASNALCVTTSAAVQMSGSVAYAQY